MARMDLKGHQFGRLSVINRVGTDANGRNVIWLCQCICGNQSRVSTIALRSGHTQSCGCFNREQAAITAAKLGAAGATHGHTRYQSEGRTRATPEYRSWNAMHSRCRYPGVGYYKLYGGRGIFVCERWFSFENFLADMGPRPVGHTLDRINPDGNYEPSNCRWATPKEQAANRRKKVKEYDGADDFAKSIDEAYRVIRERKAAGGKGWPD